MAKFLIRAVKTTEHELYVEAVDAEQAYHSMDDMISDDFESHIVDNRWDFMIEEVMTDE